MTIEIRELIIQVQVSSTRDLEGTVVAGKLTEWNEQRFLEKVKQEVIEHLCERGLL